MDTNATDNILEDFITIAWAHAMEATAPSDATPRGRLVMVGRWAAFGALAGAAIGLGFHLAAVKKWGEPEGEESP